MKLIHIYFNNTGDYLINGTIQNPSGIYTICKPYLRLTENDINNDTFHKIFQINTDPSITNINMDQIRTEFKEMMKVFKIRSYKKLIEQYRLVSVNYDSDTYIFQATRNGGYIGNDKGYHNLLDQQIILPKNKLDQFITTLKKAMLRCQ